MSKLGIVDFVANNLLDDLGVNPAWEKFRKHIYTAGVGISLFVLYISLGVEVECAPAYSNGSVIPTDMHSRHVNEYCRNSESLKLIRYSGCIFVGMNAFALLVSTLWLYIPSVIDPLRSFAKVQKLVDEINLPWNDIKRLVSTPVDSSGNSEEHQQLRQVIKLLPSFKKICKHHNKNKGGKTSASIETAPLVSSNTSADRSKPLCRCGFSGIAKFYVYRCLFLFITFLSFAITCIKLAICIGSKGDTFPCTYDLTDENEQYSCTMNVGFVVAICSSAFALLLILQMISVGYGVWKAVKVIMKENLKSRCEIKYPSIMLILKFWKSSLPSNSGILGNLIEFFFSQEFGKVVEQNVLRSGCCTDDELSILSRALYMDEDPLRNLRLVHRKYDSEQFRNIIHVTKYKLKDYKLLAAMLAKHDLWETFVFLLENVEDLNTCSEDDQKDFKESMKLNFDSLATHDKEVEKLSNKLHENQFAGSKSETHSLLYYATDLKNRSNFDTAIFLISCFEPPNPYVHYSYVDHGEFKVTSMTAVAHVNSFDHDRQSNDDHINLLSTLRKAAQFSAAPHCQEVLKEMLDIYRLKIKDNTMFMVDILNRRKFRIWDETFSEFIKLASENTHHHIEIALLGSFLPGYQLRHLDLIGCIPSVKCFEEIFRTFNYELEDCKNMVKTLAENFSWSLLVGLLNNTKTRCDSMTDEQLKFFTKLNIDLKKSQYAPGMRGFGRNIVYEALETCYPRRHDEDMFTVAHFLLRVTKPQLLSAIDDDIDCHRTLSSYMCDESDLYPTHDFDNFMEALEEFEKKSIDNEHSNE